MRKKSKNFRTVLPLPYESQAQTTWALGNSYASAGVVLMQDGKAETYLPTLFLFLHALELYLKAFLFSRGFCDRELRGFSHDLVTCIKVCHKHGLLEYVQPA